MTERTLIDALLAQQRELTVVEQFSRAHARHQIKGSHYRNLMPLSAPQPGQQYGFEVDLDKCSGCKACVTACHSLNGLDEGEAWRDTGGLVSEDWRHPFQQTVTTACHHCVDPACLNGCPVLAYEKDANSGIVRHLDDQCIGCQYCILMCPYEVPKYSTSRGIVRKCDMCAQRLSAGEAPACAQACPNDAIRITLVDQEPLLRAYRGDSTSRSREPRPTVDGHSGFSFEKYSNLRSLNFDNWLPASPDPSITIPTTRYVSQREFPGKLAPANSGQPQLQPPHWPLVWMLVLTQMGVGGLLSAWVLTINSHLPLGIVAVVLAHIGLGASLFHLGRPAKAWRSFLGWRTSWMSREILCFSAFLPLTWLAAAAVASTPTPNLARSLFGFAGVAGVLAIYCSAMIYHATQRACWTGARSIGRFFATTVVLGLALAWAVSTTLGSVSPWLVPSLAAAGLLKLALEHRCLRHGASDLSETAAWPSDGDIRRWAIECSGWLLVNPLGLLTRMRMTGLLLGAIVLPLVSLVEQHLALAITSIVLCFTSEITERYSFFRSAVSPSMPGL